LQRLATALDALIELSTRYATMAPWAPFYEQDLWEQWLQVRMLLLRSGRGNPPPLSDSGLTPDRPADLERCKSWAARLATLRRDAWHEFEQHRQPPTEWSAPRRVNDLARAFRVERTLMRRWLRQQTIRNRRKGRSAYQIDLTELSRETRERIENPDRR
jgi:hypothetical protein